MWIINSFVNLLRLCFLIRKSSETTTPVKGDNIFTEDAKKVVNLNTFLSNLVNNLKIPDNEEVSPFAEKPSHPIVKAIFRHSEHISIIAMNNFTHGSTSQFSCVSIDDVLRK